MTSRRPVLAGIDHVAITVADIETTSAFYDRLFGASVLRNHMLGDRLIIRVLNIGGGVQLSIHQHGNGVDLVAARPTPGSVDICFRIDGTIGQAAAHLQEHGIAIIEGPSPRHDSDGHAAHSIYFRDPDNNLIELMARNDPG